MGLKTFFRNPPVAFFLLLITLLAIGLRLYHLTYQSLWIDEIASMHGSDPDLGISSVITYSIGDQPPAFFLLLHAWFKVFPFSDFSGRLFALVVGILGIIAVFFLGREMKDNRVGLLASLITAVNYLHIYFSQEARFYTLVFLLSTLSFLFYVRAAKFEKVLDFVWYSVFTGALIYSHYFGLVIFATQGTLFIAITIFYPVTKRFVTLSVGAALVVILSIISWIPIFFSDAQTQAFWIPPEPFYFPIKYFYVYFKDVASCVVFSLMILVYFYDRYKDTRESRRLQRTDLILMGWAILSFLIPVVYSLVQTPMLQVRYTIIALPALFVMIAIGLTSLRPRFQQILLITTCCTSLFSLVMIERYYTKPLKEDWRGTVKLVLEKAGPSDVIVSEYAWYCNYYFKTLQSQTRAVFPSEFNTANQNPAVIWWIDGFNLKPKPDTLEINLLKQGYQLEGTDSLFRTRVSRYQQRAE